METIEMYNRIKAAYGDRVFLFRSGDFYEVYEDDAVLLADMLGLVLTSRDNVRVCGFPHRALDTYLPIIIRHGKKVGIADKE